MMHGDAGLRCDVHDGWNRFASFCPACQGINAEFGTFPMIGKKAFRKSATAAEMLLRQTPPADGFGNHSTTTQRDKE